MLLCAQLRKRRLSERFEEGFEDAPYNRRKLLVLASLLMLWILTKLSVMTS